MWELSYQLLYQRAVYPISGWMDGKVRRLARAGCGGEGEGEGGGGAGSSGTSELLVVAAACDGAQLGCRATMRGAAAFTARGTFTIPPFYRVILDSRVLLSYAWLQHTILMR